MGVKELCQAYNKNNTESAVNAAIRAEIPAGAILLDLIYELYPHRNEETQLAYIYAKLLEAKQELFKVIAEKYHLKSWVEKNDPRKEN